jgi:hypothetical protein
MTNLHIHPFVNKFLRKLHWLETYDHSAFLRSLVISLARYLVYTSQFVILLLAFEPEASILQLYMGVSALYLFHTILPMPPVADVLARTNLALVLWSGTGMSELSISLASLLVWVINLLVPAVLGSLAISTYRPVKSLNSDDAHFRPAIGPVMADEPGRS